MHTGITSGILPGISSDIPEGTISADKVRENRLRRMASRQRLALRKSPRRDPHAYDFGRYWLINQDTEAVVAGGDKGLDLDGVEQHLNKGGI